MKRSILITSLLVVLLLSHTHGQQKQIKSNPRRQHSLDYWDSATLAYSLGLHYYNNSTKKVTDEQEKVLVKHKNLVVTEKETDTYLGHDATVLFYSQWCTRCHSLASMYQRIAEILKAGTKQSNVVMALFDCEANEEHEALCTAAGVTHYPTIMYIGAGPYYDNDIVTKTLLGKDRAAGRAGHAPLKRTVKFQGNWNAGEEIRDWIRAMRGLSSWHKFGQNGFFNWLRRIGSSKKNSTIDAELPIGVGTTSPGDVVSSFQYEKLQSEYDDLMTSKEKLQETNSHAGLLLDTLLAPRTEGKDAFIELTAIDGWKKGSDNPDSVEGLVRSCVKDLSLDYCTRVATRTTHKYLYDFTKTDEDILAEVTEEEPFCGIIDKCIDNDFESEDCQKAVCPFKENTACRYLNGCIDSDVKRAYAKAMGLDLASLELEHSQSASNKANKATTGGWGYTATA